MLDQSFDGDWTAVDGEGAYRLEVQSAPTEVEGLHAAQVSVWAEQDVLFSIEIAWQGEGKSNG